MDKEKDFATWFAESVEQATPEQATPEQAISEDYSKLGDTTIFIELWNEYNLLHDGDWIQCGKDPEDGMSVPKKADREEARKLLQRIYGRLQPFEDSIVRDVEARNLPYEDWMQIAYNICKEYHLQKEVMAMLQPCTEKNTQSSPETAPERPQSEETPTLKQLLPKEILEAKKGLELFTSAVRNSYFTITPNGLEWNKGHELYGYFLQETCKALVVLKHGARCNWKLFEKFVTNHNKIKNTAKTKLSKLNDKYSQESYPGGADKVDELIKSINV